ncbi:MAG: LysR family transcriptional regulator [Rhodospirillum sp.]|nr:LysR family transcriptional regulator [Rhodospirillum sp.]MCF8487647.1 LysR family transcriptional regulator [Rhodospirillum sp.]MCF8502738.1 LysR family transcriptional regulator [Rhodospirillum sp.]
MDKFNALTAFVALADKGSFVGAARSLNQSPASITRAIASLEAHLCVSLFHRSTRVVTLSYEGAVFLERARTLLADLREAEQLVIGGASEPRGSLHVTAPVMFGRLHVLPVITDLMMGHPRLSVRMMLIDRNARIVEEGIDVAVRIGPMSDSSLTQVRIASVRQMIVASPGYVGRRGFPRRIPDLASHDIITVPSVRSGSIWRFGEKGDITTEVTPRLSVNTLDAAIAAAEAGIGLANVLSYQVADALAEGRLVRLLEDMAPPDLVVRLLYHPSRASLPSVRAFIEAMKERVGAL